MLPPVDDGITFRKLEILLAFIETGSLARAGERLGTSAVSVHRALHALEDALRCSLWVHEGRMLRPTDAARALAETAQQVLRTLDDGVRRTRRVAGYGGDTLRIGSLYSLTSRTVPIVVQGLKLRLPQLQTELVLGSDTDLMQRLHDGTIDAALMGLHAGAADLVCEPLFDDDICFAAPATSRWAGQDRIELADCAHERFVSLTAGFVTSLGFAEAFRLAGFEPQVVMQTGDIFSLMNLVHGGVGCTLLPGRVRDVLPRGAVLRPLAARYRLQQTIALHLPRARERDPNLLALLAVCRSAREQLG